ncbi:MAG: hypothetical protein ABI537_10180 [Casimicrobiaceae bacterium]
MTSRLCLAFAAVASFLAISALAQQPAPAPTGTAAVAVPPPTCAKPEFPGAFSDQRRFDRFNKDSKTYTDCIKKYIAETKAVADANIAAGNAAIKDFNAYIEEVDARQAAMKK